MKLTNNQKKFLRARGPPTTWNDKHGGPSTTWNDKHGGSPKMRDWEETI
jgi:hypothetical protein